MYRDYLLLLLIGIITNFSQINAKHVNHKEKIINTIDSIDPDKSKDRLIQMKPIDNDEENSTYEKFLKILNDEEAHIEADNSTKLPLPLKRSKSRILQGVPSAESDFGYQVAIMHIRIDVPILVCGGAIIDRHYVITAAHCVNNQRSAELVVRSGGVNGPEPMKPHKERRSFHKVTKIIIPRQYSNLPCRKHQHDIAILKVQQSFDLADTQRYKKVNLPEFDADYEKVIGVITGYGVDYANDNGTQSSKIKNFYLKYVDELRSMKLSVISNAECQDKASVILTEGTLCAKSIIQDGHSCFEDDGAPLVYEGTIIGILNDNKCDANNPELFTRVSSYLHFIKTVLESQNSADVVIL